MNRPWRVAVGIVVSGILLGLSLRDVSLEAVAASLRSAHAGLLAAALGVTLVRLWASALRWQMLLAPHRVIGVRSLFALIAVGVMANAVVPVRAGDILRAALLGARTGLPTALCLATIVIERLFDALALGALLFLALPFVTLPFWVVRVGETAVLLALGLLGALLWIERGGGKTLAGRFLNRLPRAAALRERCVSTVRSFRAGVGVLTQAGDFLRVSLCSAGIWALGALGTYLVAKSLDLSVSFLAAMVVLVVLTAGLAAPSAPGFVGTLQFFSVVALGLFGVPKSEAFSFSVLIHATQVLPLILLGALCFWREGPEQLGVRR